MNRREMLRFAIAASTASLSASCATASGYQARTQPAGSGYAEERIGEARWRVEFTGGENDTREEVESYLLYRAAELTSASGYDWFISTASEVESEAEIVVEAQRVRESPVWRPQWRRRRSLDWTDWMPAGAAASETPIPPSGRVVERERFAAREEITMGRGMAPNGAFDARRVLSDLASVSGRS
jgi:hypothetical protein